MCVFSSLSGLPVGSGGGDRNCVIETSVGSLDIAYRGRAQTLKASC